MSRYQMYWQVYFHPVSRSAELLLSKILHRVKALHDASYQFQHEPMHFYSFFSGDIALADYIALDETIMMYYFQMWVHERDSILADLCDRFINRKLFKFTSFNPQEKMAKLNQLEQLFTQVGIDPNYYLEVVFSSDSPYDLYRPGEEEERLPIYLQMEDGTLQELSQASEIVQSISGNKRTDQKLYYPADLIENLPDNSEKQQIKALLGMK